MIIAKGVGNALDPVATMRTGVVIPFGERGINQIRTGKLVRQINRLPMGWMETGGGGQRHHGHHPGVPMRGRYTQVVSAPQGAGPEYVAAAQAQAEQTVAAAQDQMNGLGEAEDYYTGPDYSGLSFLGQITAVLRAGRPAIASFGGVRVLLLPYPVGYQHVVDHLDQPQGGLSGPFDDGLGRARRARARGGRGAGRGRGRGRARRGRGRMPKGGPITATSADKPSLPPGPQPPAAPMPCPPGMIPGATPGTCFPAPLTTGGPAYPGYPPPGYPAATPSGPPLMRPTCPPGWLRLGGQCYDQSKATAPLNVFGKQLCMGRTLIDGKCFPPDAMRPTTMQPVPGTDGRPPPTTGPLPMTASGLCPSGFTPNPASRQCLPPSDAPPPYTPPGAVLPVQTPWGPTCPPGMMVGPDGRTCAPSTSPFAPPPPAGGPPEGGQPPGGGAPSGGGGGGPQVPPPPSEARGGSYDEDEDDEGGEDEEAADEDIDGIAGAGGLYSGNVYYRW